MDRIELHGIKAFGYHGVLESEREKGQEFICDLTMWLDFTRAAIHDDLALTVDYGKVAELTHSILSGEPVDLIETLAHTISEQLLSHFPLLYAAEVIIHKPDAPIPLPFSDVKVIGRSSRKSVQGSRGRAVQHDEFAGKKHTHDLVLSLGSNQGDSIRILENAINMLPSKRAVSPLYRTKAWGKADQDDFYNCIVIVDVNSLPLFSWLELGQLIEKSAGRTRTVMWGPRTLDIDLISSTDPDMQHISGPRLTLPHPYAYVRAFVLRPWLDIAPEATLFHLGANEPIVSLWEGLRKEDQESLTRVAEPSADDMGMLRWRHTTTSSHSSSA